MEFEKPQHPVISRTDDWIGMPIANDNTPNDSIALGTRVVTDKQEVTNRLYPLMNSSGESHAAGSVWIGSLLQPIVSTTPLSILAMEYTSFRYKSIVVTVSCSDPKGVAGGYIAGWYPFRNWFETANLGPTFATTEASRHALNLMTKQRLTMSPESAFSSFAEPNDIQFTIPWQYPFSHLDFSDLFDGDPWNSDIRVPVLSPVLYIMNLAQDFVTSVTSLPPLFRVFVQFEEFELLGPYAAYFPLGESAKGFVDSTKFKAKFKGKSLKPQSGLEAAAVVAATELVVAAGAEIVDSALEGQAEAAFGESLSQGTFEDPSSVQMSYAGDTTSTAPPKLMPIFSDFLSGGNKHPIIGFLTKPQYIGTFPVSSWDTPVFFWADPMAPLGDMNTDNPTCTWFNWFGQCANYWRGTLVFDIVITGHSMVEVEYMLNMTYPTSLPEEYRIPSNLDPELNVQMRGVCRGTHTITVPMPFQTRDDFVPVMDKHDISVEERLDFCPSGARLVTRVLSTMLDVVPTLHYHVFMRAEKDFTFFWPRPPGLYDVDNPLTDTVVITDKKKKRIAKAKCSEQVGIPKTDVVFETRAQLQPPESVHPPLVYVEDFFKFWSRSLPYHTVDGSDQPIVEAADMSAPAWISVGESAAWTLNVNNSWYVTNDYLSLYSSMYMLYQGSIGIKVLCKGDTTPGTYKYISLGTRAPRQLAHNPFTAVASYVPSLANFGVGTVITPADKQPVLELTLPFRSLTAWGHVVPFIDFDEGNRAPYDYVFEVVNTNVNLHEPSGDLIDSLFRKAGPDYALAVQTLVPPAPLWMAKGYHWSA